MKADAMLMLPHQIELEEVKEMAITSKSETDRRVEDLSLANASLKALQVPLSLALSLSLSLSRARARSLSSSLLLSCSLAHGQRRAGM